MKKIQQGGLRRRLALGAAGAKSGLGLLSARASGLLLPKEQQQQHHDAALEREAMRFVAQLGELKGAYVKIGQMMALYGEHLLPKPITKALHTLEHQTKALHWDAIEPCLIKELGDDRKNLTIEPTAFAAASLAQVHRASLASDPKPLCLKIQYPGVADAIHDDFDSVVQMLKLAKWLKAGREAEQFVEDLKALLLQEVDYHHEQRTLQHMHQLLAGESNVKVPQPVSVLSTARCLTMEYCEGYSVTDEAVQCLSQERRNRLAYAMLSVFFKEVFEWNLMQTDPNFGNYRIAIDDSEGQDQLVLLDFGAVHQLPETFSQSLKSAILAAYQRDHPSLIDALIALRCLRDSDADSVKASFAEFCCFIIEPFRNDFESMPDHAHDGARYDWRESRLLRRAGKLGSQSTLVKGFVMPPREFMLLVRKLTGVFTFVSTLGAKLDASPLIEQYL